MRQPARQVINGAVKNQLRQILQDEVPIRGTEHRLLPTVAVPPGGSFRPRQLNLLTMSPDQVIGAGDYEVAVHMYCTKVYTLDGSGNRYRLATLGGKMSRALGELYVQASRARIPTRDIQVLSWSIQSGVPFDKLPGRHQQLVRQLIPHHIPSMRQGFVEQVTSRWNQVSRISGGRVPSFQSLLGEMGPVGDVASTVLRARQQVLTERFSYQSLERAFVQNQNVSLTGGQEATGWTKISDSLYLRVLAPQGALSRAKVQIRVLPVQRSSGKAVSKALPDGTLVSQGAATVAGAASVAELLEALVAAGVLSPGALILGSAITAGLLLYLITSTIAIPEAPGHQAGTFTIEPGIEGGDTDPWANDDWTTGDGGVAPPPWPSTPGANEDWEPNPNPPRWPQQPQPRPVPPIIWPDAPTTPQDDDKRRDACKDRADTWNFTQVPGFPGLCYGNARGNDDRPHSLVYGHKVRLSVGTPIEHISASVWARGAAARKEDYYGIGVEFDAFNRSTRELVDIKFWNEGEIYDLEQFFPFDRSKMINDVIRQAERQIKAQKDLPVSRIVWIMPSQKLATQWTRVLKGRRINDEEIGIRVMNP